MRSQYKLKNRYFKTQPCCFDTSLCVPLLSLAPPLPYSYKYRKAAALYASCSQSLEAKPCPENSGEYLGGRIGEWETVFHEQYLVDIYYLTTLEYLLSLLIVSSPLAPHRFLSSRSPSFSLLSLPIVFSPLAPHRFLSSRSPSFSLLSLHSFPSSHFPLVALLIHSPCFPHCFSTISDTNDFTNLPARAPWGVYPASFSQNHPRDQSSSISLSVPKSVAPFAASRAQSGWKIWIAKIFLKDFNFLFVMP